MRERERIFQLLVSFLHACNGWAWVRLKAGSWQLVQVLHTSGRDPAPGALARRLPGAQEQMLELGVELGLKPGPCTASCGCPGWCAMCLLFHQLCEAPRPCLSLRSYVGSPRDPLWSVWAEAVCHVLCEGLKSWWVFLVVLKS